MDHITILPMLSFLSSLAYQGLENVIEGILPMMELLELKRFLPLTASPILFVLSTCTPQGEMKMPVCIEDECNSELPPASLLFRAARQYAYGVLFSLAETQRRLERLALRKRAPLEGME